MARKVPVGTSTRVLLLFVSLLGGCATMRVYPGDRRPASETAIIKGNLRYWFFYSKSVSVTAVSDSYSVVPVRFVVSDTLWVPLEKYNVKHERSTGITSVLLDLLLPGGGAGLFRHTKVAVTPGEYLVNVHMYQWFGVGWPAFYFGYNDKYVLLRTEAGHTYTARNKTLWGKGASVFYVEDDTGTLVAGEKPE